MDKYMQAINQLEKFAAHLSCDNHISALDTYRRVDYQAAGIIEVAMYDSSISSDDFMRIQDEARRVVDMYYNVWNNSEKEAIRCLLSHVK